VERLADSMYREIICVHCEFYKPGESSECGAFKILKFLIDSGKLSEEEVGFAALEACRKSSSEKV
jgi:hypothetical protein